MNSLDTSPKFDRVARPLASPAALPAALLAVMAMVQNACPAAGQMDDDSAADDDDATLPDSDDDDDMTPADDDDSTPKCNDETLGLSADCPANSCYSLLRDRPAASSDVYWLDLDDSGDVPPVRLRCDMRLDPLGDPQGWTVLDAIRAPEIAGLFTSWEVYPQGGGAAFAGPNFYADPSPSCTSWGQWSGVLGALGNAGFCASPDCETILDHDGVDEVFRMDGSLYGCNGADGGNDIMLSSAGGVSPGCPGNPCNDGADNSAPTLGITDFDGNGVADGYCVAVTTYAW